MERHFRYIARELLKGEPKYFKESDKEIERIAVEARKFILQTAEFGLRGSELPPAENNKLRQTSLRSLLNYSSETELLFSTIVDVLRGEYVQFEEGNDSIVPVTREYEGEIVSFGFSTTEEAQLAFTNRLKWLNSKFILDVITPPSIVLNKRSGVISLEIGLKMHSYAGLEGDIEKGIFEEGLNYRSNLFPRMNGLTSIQLIPAQVTNPQKIMQLFRFSGKLQKNIKFQTHTTIDDFEMFQYQLDLAGLRNDLLKTTAYGNKQIESITKNAQIKFLKENEDLIRKFTMVRLSKVRIGQTEYYIYAVADQPTQKQEEYRLASHGKLIFGGNK